MQVTSCLGGLGNLIGRSSIIDLKIGILLKRIEGHTYLHHCHLDGFMKTN